MILVDTSVWIEHFRGRTERLAVLLEEEQVVTHPFVVGELACGSLRNRAEILSLLQTLPAAEVAQHQEVLSFVEDNRLFGRGVGWVDTHLLASARLSDAALWTLDRPLLRIASRLKLAYGAPH